MREPSASYVRLAMAETDPLSRFDWHVRDALAHLHDPGRLQRSPLVRFVRSDPTARSQGPGRALHRALVDAIEALRPTSEITASALASRTYLVLRLRYVEALDIAQIADRLALSKTGYFASQRHAIDAVASVLRERWGLGEEAERSGRESERAREYGGADSGMEVRRAEGAWRERLATNLPAQLTSFVGREREVAEVRRLLGTTRLLTLTGTGGCGKTRLALTVAEALGEESPERYPDGVWAVELAALSDPQFVPQTVALALEVREQPGRPLLATLISLLRTRSLLLILDNCEHLLDAWCSRRVWWTKRAIGRSRSEVARISRACDSRRGR